VDGIKVVLLLDLVLGMVRCGICSSSI
jgi:hypothetical protein